ncbi:MAG: ABC transporter ATP-binding protein [Sedimentisphaerales bacterium]|nr:ABC transporter ATP-binding protein [Sedimentisphaerales bacterium]
MSGIIEVENLSFGYISESIILKDMSFEVAQGAFIAIVGPNGAGKSTLLNLMCQVLRPKSGMIRIDSKPIGSYGTQALAEKVAVVRQEFVPIFGFSVMETVLMARTPYYSPMGFERQADREIVDDALKSTDTAQFASRPLTSLSSGERQRVFIARALAQNSLIMLLDEPTNFLDLKHQVGIYDLLKTAQVEKGKTIIAVTHDINLAAQYCDEILLLGTDSSYHFGKTKTVFLPEKIKEIFKVDIFAGKVGQESFFIPLGKYAKNGKQINYESRGSEP